MSTGDAPSGATHHEGDAQAKQKQKALTFLPLVALIFFDVSGGPFGTEVSTHAHRGRNHSRSCRVRIQHAPNAIAAFFQLHRSHASIPLL